jgi:hypothetical protein
MMHEPVSRCLSLGRNPEEQVAGTGTGMSVGEVPLIHPAWTAGITIIDSETKNDRYGGDYPRNAPHQRGSRHHAQF